MEQKDFLELVDRYLAGTASLQEQQLLEEYYKRLEAANGHDLSSEEPGLREEIFQKIRSRIEAPATPLIKMKQPWLMRIVAVAAAVVIIAGIYWSATRRSNDPAVLVQQKSEKSAPLLSPGRDAAILTLAGGKTVRLDSASGAIKKEEGTTIINMNGVLTYANTKGPGKVEFHTISTARGNQYQLLLADGSKVYLNSASSLYFPSAFTGSSRDVELLSGEAYFEIAADRAHPFHVKTREMSIEVTGTHFNINAYSDEGPVATTLVEGKIRVTAGTASSTVVPGQQATLYNTNFNLSRPDINKVIAWRSGFFDFDKMDIQSIMRQVSRWYDVDIEYDGHTTTEKFGGRFNRQLPLLQLLKLLEANDVQFSVEGKKVIVKS